MMKKSLVLLLAFLCVAGVATPAFAKSTGKSKSKAKSDSSAQKLTQKEKKDITIDSDYIESKSDLKKNVKYYNGAYYIKDIPMIDQGNKPTCVPCTLKRLFEYYSDGRAKISQTTIEKAIGYDSKNATNIVLMMKGVERYSRQLKIKCETLYYAYDSESLCSQYLREYNEACKESKQGRPVEVTPAVFRDQGACEKMLKMMYYKNWREAKKADTRAKDVQKDILKNIKAGCPIMWAVTLGLYKENTGKANIVGGHMRLIIGFDDEKKEIYYSDSWGTNHTKKKMPWDDAWAITNAMILLCP